MATPLAPGASVDVRFLLGIRQTGSFEIYLNAETNQVPLMMTLTRDGDGDDGSISAGKRRWDVRPSTAVEAVATASTVNEPAPAAVAPARRAAVAPILILPRSEPGEDEE